MNNIKVLIIEDERIIAQDIKKSLEDLGYEVCTLVTSGEDAVEKAKRELPDLVLMDIMLKGEMDGIETANQLRSHFDVPIIYLTAYTDENILQRAKITEPMGYLVKPFKDRELYSAIEIALYKHKVEKEKERLITKLQTALSEIKTLRGILPICVHCKKIRDDKDYWEKVDIYIYKHSEAEISHSICPECIKKHYPKEYKTFFDEKE